MVSTKSLNTLDRHGVVGRGTETAHKTVTFDADHASFGGESAELVGQALETVVHNETDIHQRERSSLAAVPLKRGLESISL